MKKYFFFVSIIFMLNFIACEISAQVSVNTDGSPPNPSAGLDVNFSDKGLLPPLMTHAQMNAIENPADGLIIYCTDCTNSGAGALAVFINGAWYVIFLRQPVLCHSFHRLASMCQLQPRSPGTGIR